VARGGLGEEQVANDLKTKPRVVAKFQNGADSSCWCNRLELKQIVWPKGHSYKIITEREHGKIKVPYHQDVHSKLGYFTTNLDLYFTVLDILSYILL